MEDIIDIIVTETTNLIEITSQPTDEIIDVNIIDNREDVTLNVTPTVVEININSLTSNFGVAWGDITGTLADQTDLQNVLNAKADLVDGKVPSSQLPSYVDDVVEVANYASLPATGEVGKIYITLDTNYIYRWTGSTYVEIKDSSAVWGAITGTLSNQTDLQNALNLKANDSLVVHLAGTETITGAKTFSSAVTAPNFVLSGGTGNTGLYYGHTDRVVLANYTVGGIDFEVNGGSIVATLFPSGNYGLGITLDAGYKLDVNGTARISGALSGTSASFSSSITASSLIKSGGTSSQFLKADGSVDSSTYLTTGTAASTYLPLTGGTLTGGLNGTFGNFSSYVNAQTIDLSNSTASNALRITHTNGSYHAVSIIATGNSALYASGSVTVVGTIQATSTIIAQAGLSNGAGQSFTLPSLTGTLALTSDLSSYLPLSGGTLTGALSGTSASFSGAVTVLNANINLSNSYYLTGRNSANNNYLAIIGRNSSDKIVIDPDGFGVNVNGNTTFTGNVGIRVASSGDSLNVLGTANNNTAYFAGSATSGQSFGLQIRAGSSITDYSLLVQNNSGADYFRIVGNGAATFSSSVTQSASDSRLLGGDSVGRYIISNSDTSAYMAIYGSSHATSANQVSLITNSQITFNSGSGYAERMRITSSGNVGIGTTSPTGKLSLYDTSDLWVNIARGSSFVNIGVDSTGTFYNTNSNHRWLYNSGSNEAMRITSGGNVGIGTTSPNHRLSFGTPANGTRSLGLWENGSSFFGLGNDANQVTIYAGGNTTAPIASFVAGGNVGIGTTAPTVAAGMGLVINGGATSPRIALKNNASGDASTDGFQLVLTTENEAVLENRENASMRFLTNATEAMRITSSGNVGIGTTAPGTKLHLISALGTDAFAIGETGSNQRFRIGQESSYTGNYINSTNIDLKLMTYTDGGSGGNIVFYTSTNTTINERMRIASDGRVLMPQVYNNTSGVSANLFIAADGALVRATSSIKYKKDVINYDKGLDLVQQMRPVYYKGISEMDGDRQFAGFIAEEINELGLSEFVQFNNDNEVEGLGYGNITALLVNAIKDLKAELDTLKNK